MASFTDRDICEIKSYLQRIKPYGAKGIKRATRPRTYYITTLEIILAVTSILFVSVNGLRSSLIRMKRQPQSVQLNMFKGDSSDPVDPAKAGEQINFLINSAVDLMKRFMPKKTKRSGMTPLHSDNRTIHQQIMAEKKDYKSVRLSFSSSHRQLIALSNAVNAHEYLSLPVEEYSVLDSNLITRIRGVRNSTEEGAGVTASSANTNNKDTSADRFVLTLPLGDITSGASSLGMVGMSMGSTQQSGGGFSMTGPTASPSSSKKAFRLDASVRTEVTVRPDPVNGRVIMESGPIFFVPTAKKPPPQRIDDKQRQSSIGDDDDNVAGTVYTTAVEEEEEVEEDDEGEFMDSLPPWLVWGGVERQSKMRKEQKRESKLSQEQQQDKILGAAAVDSNQQENADGNSIDDSIVSEQQDRTPFKQTTSSATVTPLSSAESVTKNVEEAEANREREGKEKNEKTEVKSEEQGAKSSVQARFRVELKWDPKLAASQEGDEAGGEGKDGKKRGNIVRSFMSSFNFRGSSKKSRSSSSEGSDNRIEEVVGVTGTATTAGDENTGDVTVGTIQTEKINNGSSITVDRSGLIGEEAGVGGNGRSNSELVRSAMEIREETSMNITEDRSTISISTSSSSSSSSASTSSSSSSSLPVRASVTVWVDMNLPVRSDLHPALSFPPVGLLLGQAGALMTKAILSGAAPALSKLLVADYDKRMGPSKSNSTSTSNSTSNKDSQSESNNSNNADAVKGDLNERGVGPYDHLTADL
jgi:hypothetical protein